MAEKIQIRLTQDDIEQILLNHIYDNYPIEEKGLEYDSNEVDAITDDMVFTFKEEG